MENFEQKNFLCHKKQLALINIHKLFYKLLSSK
jgi:hypothetical protein